MGARKPFITRGRSVNIPANVDRIFLRGLEIECLIGFMDWERRVKQTVTLDVELPVDCRHAARTDTVADTLDYKTVAKRIIAFVESTQYQLVESLAEQTAQLVLQEFGVAWIRLSISKPGAIRGSRDVGVTIERTRADLRAPRLPDRDRGG